VEKGKKSQFDFKVRYLEPGKRARTPKHIHIIIDLYLKSSGNPSLTTSLIDHIINNIIMKVMPATTFPPSLQVFSLNHAAQFAGLNPYGEYGVEFLLVLVELLMIQEKTNYPNGTLNLSLFQKFRNNADIFSVVSAATYH
jgi:hypothetical protein